LTHYHRAVLLFIHDLKYIITYLQTRPLEAMDVPVLIPDPFSLVASVKEVVYGHLEYYSFPLCG
jgi:hypothetical protein